MFQSYPQILVLLLPLLIRMYLLYLMIQMIPLHPERLLLPELLESLMFLRIRLLPELLESLMFLRIL
jgi:hypothetical protein